MFRGWTKKSKVIAVAVAAALVAGGTLLGLNLEGTNHSAAQPATSSARGSGSSASAPGPSGSATRPSDSGSSSGSNFDTEPVSTNPGPQKVAVICTTVSGNLSGAITISSCSQLPATGGSGTFPGTLLDSAGSGTITWNGTGTTTFVYVSSHPPSQRRKCPDGDSETTLRGSVTANRPLGTGNVGVKGAVHAKLCIDSSSKVSLLAGRTFQL